MRDRYFDVEIEYAKASPDDVLMRITAYNRGPDPRADLAPATGLVSQQLELVETNQHGQR